MVGYPFLSSLYPHTEEYGCCTLEIFVFESNLYETVLEKANVYVQGLFENRHNPQLYVGQKNLLYENISSCLKREDCNV